MTRLEQRLIGRTITKVDLNPFRSRPDSKSPVAHNPVITLDDGTEVRFNTQETETGEYGTALCVSPKASRTRKATV